MAFFSFRDHRFIVGSCFGSAAVLMKRWKHLLLDVLGHDPMICSRRISILLFWLILHPCAEFGLSCTCLFDNVGVRDVFVWNDLSGVMYVHVCTVMEVDVQPCTVCLLEKELTRQIKTDCVYVRFFMNDFSTTRLSFFSSSRPGRPPKRSLGVAMQDSSRLLPHSVHGLLSPGLLSPTGKSSTCHLNDWCRDVRIAIIYWD